MIQIEQSDTATNGAQPYTGWDALLVGLLGVALLTAGWLDVRSYLVHERARASNGPPPEFAFLDDPAGEIVGADEIYRGGADFVLLDNLGSVEKAGAIRFRHALGPRSVLLISTRCTRGVLDWRADNAVEGQDITVTCDGQLLEQFTHQPTGTITRQYALALHPGLNDLTFVFARYNHHGLEGPDNDPRLLTGTTFRLLNLRLQ